MLDAPPTAHIGGDRAVVSDLLAILPGYAGRPVSWWRDLPWTVTRSGESLLLTLDHLREELMIDRANRERVLACGAVIENLRLAAHHHGAELDVASWPEGVASSMVARLTLGAPLVARREEEALFGVLSRPDHPAVRDVGGAASPALLAVLRHAARSEGGWLDVVTDDARRMLVADLESEAEVIANAERGARRILQSGDVASRGSARLVVGGGPTLAELLATLGANVQPSSEWTTSREWTARGSTMDAPILAVLGAGDDTPVGWLRAGTALQRVLLHASVQGLRASFLNAPLLHPLLRDAMRAILFPVGTPHAIIRFDFEATDASRTPGRLGVRSASAA